jgi:hypothetical protein
MNKSLWTEWETERKTLWILSIDLKNDSVFELNSSALSLIRQTQNYSIFCVSAFIDRDECATNRDRQDRLKERRKPMPINSCSWGFNFSKKKVWCVCTLHTTRDCADNFALVRAHHTHLSWEFFFFWAIFTLAHLHLSHSHSLYQTHLLTHFAFTIFINPASQFHRPKI